jgi:bifunctional non-homologous end joining protein LigD
LSLARRRRATETGSDQQRWLAHSSFSKGDDLRAHPLEKRRKALARLVAGLDGVLFSEALAAEGAAAFAKACKLGLEGIVSKREGRRF